MILLHDFVTDFVVVILSQSEALGKMALGIVKIYLGSPFSANRCSSQSVCLRSVCSRSVGLWSVVVDPIFGLLGKLEIFFDCKSLFLFLKLYALVLKVNDTNIVLVCNHNNENWKAIYMLSSSTKYSLSMFLRIKSN